MIILTLGGIEIINLITNKMKTKKKKTIKGKVCKHCGHVIYWTKYFGYRCMCDNPEPRN